MITEYTIVCRHCKECRYNKVLFIGGEFAFQCPECSAILLFYENVFFDVRDHFKDKRWSRYVGYWHNDRMHEVQNEKIAKQFQIILEHRVPDKHSLIRRRISNKYDDARYFVASMIHDHFQEAFRGLFQMKGNLERLGSYNVLLVPHNYNYLVEDPLKHKGIDELWYVPLNKQMRWPYVHDAEAAKECWKLSNAIQEELDKLEGISVCVSKRAGTVPNGKQLLKQLLEPTSPQPILDTKGKDLFEKYVGILIHSDTPERAGLSKVEQLELLALTVGQAGYSPLLIATTSAELKIADKTTLQAVYVPEIDRQAQLYRDSIGFVIGTNCSGCNVPALYGIPMFVYVKGRGFPDDFYCFARMASQYNKKSLPWFAELEKADNIVEYKVPREKGIDITTTLPDLIRELRKRMRAKGESRGRLVIEKGSEEACPKCTKRNFSTSKLLKHTDVYVAFVCDCGCRYVARYGLTTGSLVSVEEKEQELVVYPEHKAKIEKIVLNKKKNPIYFLATKPSIADLYYVLPSLLLLRKDYPMHSLRVITHAEYVDLIPKALVDELYLITLDSPYQLIKEICVEEKYLSELIGTAPLINNYPGVLPHSRNTYYELRKFFDVANSIPQDIIICCRLGNRNWPSLPVLEALVAAFKKRELTFKVIVFPRNEKVRLEQGWLSVPNLVVNPDLKSQFALAKQAKVWICPHGASEVIPSIVQASILELETDPPWWKSGETQPIRFGLPMQKFRQIKRQTLDLVTADEILLELQHLL